MHKVALILAMLFVAQHASAAEVAVPAYAIIPQKSFLKFFAIQNNAPLEGKFERFTATIHFDPDRLDKSSIVVEVDTDSVSAAHAEVQNNLKFPEWLSTKVFPKAVFKSKKISRVPMTDNYYADGELTLRGKTLPVMLNFQLENVASNRTIANGFVTLHRRDYGIGQGEWAKDDVLKDEVRVEFRLVADKQ